MQASEDELEACLALTNMDPDRMVSIDHTNHTDKSSYSDSNTSESKMESPSEPVESQYTLRHRITKGSMENIKERLLRLSERNKEIQESIESLRTAVIDELFNHMRVRHIAIGQLGRGDLDPDMESLCLQALGNREQFMVGKEVELLSLVELLNTHKSVLEFAIAADAELEANLKIVDTCPDPETRYSGDLTHHFPRMAALASLTAKDFSVTTPEANFDSIAPDTSGFPLFSKLPPEIRLEIWRMSSPDCRILTHNSKHNAQLSILNTCQESRNVTQSVYSRLLSPIFDATSTKTEIMYANLDRDILIRDLATPRADRPNASLFDLDRDDFNESCLRTFMGLSRIKHLAIAFDLLRQNGGIVFGPIQAACPNLESLILFPSSQVEGARWKTPSLSDQHTLKFIDLDSNLIDYIHFRYDQVRDWTIRRKALRGLWTLHTLYDNAIQYFSVFPDYTRNFGRNWTPKIRVCLLAKWNEEFQGWQTRYLEGDKYSRGFFGLGKWHRGFIESDIVADRDGEVLSRYDGISRLFE